MSEETDIISPKRRETVTFEHTVENKQDQEDGESELDEDASETSQTSEGREDSISEKLNDSLLQSQMEMPNNPLDELTDQQLIDVITEMETDLGHIQLENSIFYDFLQSNDPSLLEGFQALLEFARGEAPPPPELGSEILIRKTAKLDTMSLSSMLDSRGPKINISQKIDMVVKATEETQAKLESFVKKSHKTRRRLRAELEEFSIRESDIREARDIFEFNIVTQGVDKLTQRIPAEKFIRYMQDWLKSATLNIEKLRLRTASLKVHFKKVSQTLVQRQELGENVHAVDFDQLEIENKHFLEKIEQKHHHLIELKKMNGGANLVLSKHKKYLQKQLQEYNNLKTKFGEHEKLMAEIEKECDTVAEEADKAKNRLEYITKLKNTYTVPDVMEYIKIKKDLSEYRKNVKVWHRRKKIQDIALNACIRQMKNITGNSIIDSIWFVDPSLDEGSDYEEMM